MRPGCFRLRGWFFFRSAASAVAASCCVLRL
nr:MAG TPA: hypothetical protein [Caudoviricetes sp.]